MAKTEDIKRRVGNTPTPAGEEHPSIHGSAPSGVQPATRPGSGTVGSKVSGGVNGLRVGNTPAVIADLDEAPQRHTSGQGQVEFSSENFPVREHATQSGQAFSGNGGQFEFETAPENASNYIQRARVPRQKAQDAEVKSLSDKRFANEKEQRKVSESLHPKKDVTNPRNQR